MALLLSAAALVAYRAGSHPVAALVAASTESRDQVVTSTVSVAEAWSTEDDGDTLGLLLEGVRQEPLGPVAARAVAELCNESDVGGTETAHLAVLAHPGDVVVTEDPEAMERLLAARGVAARLVAC